MGGLGGSLPLCPIRKHCWEWARVYMNSCLCDVKDGISFGLGTLSVISWSIAEVPQLMTNYKEKSTEGMSVALLLTWVIGDVFNLFGCLLEPATLATQFYVAVLYTAVALVLTLQTVYYGHIYHRLGACKIGLYSKGLKICGEEDKIKKQRDSWKMGSLAEDSVMQNDKCGLPSSPIPVAASVATGYGSMGRDRYYISARSLASSPTPVMGSDSYRWTYWKKAPASIIDQSAEEDTLLGRTITARSAPPLDTKNLFCVVSVITFFIGSFGLELSAARRSYTALRNGPGIIIPIKRKLLEVADPSVRNNNSSSMLGIYLGWAMAVIYTGGRLPQIYLNIRRGTVKGLNPLMFFLALLGNSTYAASILVSSIEWYKIEPNLPWLFDAAVCMVLDSVILVQFVYYSQWRTKYADDSDQQHYLAV